MTMRMNRVLLWQALLVLLGFMVGCSSQSTPIDTEHLPPEQQKIVTEAQRFLGASRLEFQAPPQLIRIEKTTHARARRFIDRHDSLSFGKKKGANSPVWLVVFEGEMRIIPPDPLRTFTPGPFTHQCVYVIVDPATHMNALRNSRCPRR